MPGLRDPTWIAKNGGWQASCPDLPHGARHVRVGSADPTYGAGKAILSGRLRLASYRTSIRGSARARIARVTEGAVVLDR